MARIGTVIFISIVPARSAYGPANLDTAIRATKNALNPPITIRPFLISSSDNRPISFMDIAKIAIAPDIFKSILPALSACFPAKSDTATRLANNISQATITARPFKTSPGDKLAINFIVMANIATAAENFKNIFPALSALSPTKSDTPTRAPNSISQATMTAKPCPTSTIDKPDNDFIANANSPTATANFKNIVPALEAFSPAKNEAAINALNNISQAVITAKPLIKSPVDILANNFISNAKIPMAIAKLANILPAPAAFPCEIRDNTVSTAKIALILVITPIALSISPSDSIDNSFIAAAIISKLVAILRNILPTLFAFLAASAFFTYFPNATIIRPIALIMPITAHKACVLRSGSIVDIIFIAADNISKDTPNEAAIKPILTIPLVLSIFDATLDNTPKATTSAISDPTAPNNLPWSTYVNKANDAARIPIAFAMFKIPTVYMLNFLALASPLRLSDMVLNTPLMLSPIFPKPSKAFPNLSNIFKNLLTKNPAPTTIPTNAASPQSIF